MSRQKDKVVYSTNPDYKLPEEEGIAQNNVPENKQTLYVSLQRLKGGKMATIVENFTGTTGALEDLGKQLKSKCGVGGTVKEGIILLQGEHREKVIAYLTSLGYKTRRKGG
jgi:translation initiation factor 1